MAISSMTGFGSTSRGWAEAPGSSASVHVEMRAVNSRYLEVKVRQPFGVAAEHALRKQVEAAIGRGRIDLWVHIHASGEDGTSALASAGVEVMRLEVAVRAAVEASRRAAEAGLEVSAPSSVELLRFSGALATAEGNHPPPPFLGELVGEALAELQKMRRAEGEALREVLSTLLDELDATMTRLRTIIADQGDQIHARLLQRIEELCVRVAALTPERDRVAQEAALLVAKADVAEELARIDSHLGQARAVLAEQARSGQGKTLDFLSQELLREITTIGGKLQTGSAIVIEAKGIVGRVREQVQNVE